VIALLEIPDDPLFWIVALSVLYLLARIWWRVRKGPAAGGRCSREHNKIVFRTQRDAQKSVERSRSRSGKERGKNPLDHEYRCPYYDHWHVSSKPQRR